MKLVNSISKMYTFIRISEAGLKQNLSKEIMTQ